MDEEISIVYIGAHPQILEIVVRLLNKQPDWNAIGLNCPDELIRVCRESKFNIVLLGGGLSAAEEEQVRHFVVHECAESRLVPHYGGGSGLLYAEIIEALR